MELQSLASDSVFHDDEEECEDTDDEVEPFSTDSETELAIGGELQMTDRASSSGRMPLGEGGSWSQETLF